MFNADLNCWRLVVSPPSLLASDAVDDGQPGARRSCRVPDTAGADYSRRDTIENGLHLNSFFARGRT
jgi:hypothetical protein